MKRPQATRPPRRTPRSRQGGRKTIPALIRYAIQREKQRKEREQARLKEKNRAKTEHARIMARAAKAHKRAQKMSSQGYNPQSLTDFELIYNREKARSKKTKPERDYELIQEATDYFLNSEAVRNWEQLGEGNGIGEEVREILQRDGNSFWKVYYYLRDMGLGSWEAIDEIDNYQRERGGKPISAKLEEYADIIYRYEKTGEDIAEAAKKNSKFADFYAL